MSVFLESKSPRTRRMSAVSPRRGHSSGAIPRAPQVSKFRRTAMRMTVSIGVAVLVVMAPVLPVASASSLDVPPPDRTALIIGPTTIPTPDRYMVDIIKNQYIAPTHPGQDIDYVAVTTPEEWWPITGLSRLIVSVFGDPRIWGPGGAGWPDEPWWKLSGLFDLTIDQSVRAGVGDLERAMAEHGNDNLVIYGFSQGAVVANVEKRKLAEQYPVGTEAPNIDFVLQGDLNLPNGGVFSRFSGLYLPILDWTFNGAAPTDTQFDTVEINRQYDFWADFPMYPLNVIADANALLGGAYVHARAFDVSLPADPTSSAAYQGTHGDTSYYFFPTADLPLFGPLRTLGVPESLIDVVEPFFRVLVELGYDRSIPPWQPTPARLIPIFDPAKVTADLVNAIGEGFNNALALFGLPPLLSIPAAPDTGSAKADVADNVDGTVEQNPADDLNGAVEQNPADNLNGAVERNPADNLNGTVEQNPADNLNGTVERNPADNLNGTVQQNREDDVEGTVEQNPADNINGTVERNPADNIEGTPADDIDRKQQTTLTGTRQTTSTGKSSGTHQTASTGTSRGTRQTVRGDADPPSTHSAADGSPVQHAAPSADGRRVHRGAANAPDRIQGLQGNRHGVVASD